VYDNEWPHSKSLPDAQLIIAAGVWKMTLPVSNKVNSLSGLLNPEDRGTALIQNSGTHLI
jgi:hypothetical protein